MTDRRPETRPVAVVTGAGRGIGRAAAISLAADGCRVALVSRSGADLRAVAERIRSGGGEAAWYVTDVADPEAVGETWNRVLERYGSADYLVNNAAVVEPVGPVAETDPRAWARTVEINLLGAFYWARQALVPMLERGSGSLLNVVSGMGRGVFPRFSAYSVSKAGLIHLTRVMAEEVRGTGVTVNGLDPGMVRTSMQERLRGIPPERIGREMWERLRAAHERGWLKPPEVVGRWIAAFLGGAGRRITGEIGTLAEFRDRHGIPIPPAP